MASSNPMYERSGSKLPPGDSIHLSMALPGQNKATPPSRIGPGLGMFIAVIIMGLGIYGMAHFRFGEHLDHGCESAVATFVGAIIFSVSLYYYKKRTKTLNEVSTETVESTKKAVRSARESEKRLLKQLRKQTSRVTAVFNDGPSSGPKRLAARTIND